MPNKIKIAVSSCLLGEAVRYDGTDKHIQIITEQLGNKYNLVSLCPEMAIGMGVPRPPIHLVERESGIQAVGVDNPATNVTRLLVDYAKDVVKSHAEIYGYIFKKNSPSCGTKNVKVMNGSGQYQRRGQGMYAAEIMAALPLLPVIDEDAFLDEKLREGFLEKVENYFSSLQ